VEAAERAKQNLRSLTCYHPSPQKGWRDNDWFKTRVPDQTPSRPRFIQSANRPLPSTPPLSYARTRSNFHPNGWAERPCL